MRGENAFSTQRRKTRDRNDGDSSSNESNNCRVKTDWNRSRREEEERCFVNEMIISTINSLNNHKIRSPISVDAFARAHIYVYVYIILKLAIKISGNNRQDRYPIAL